MNKTDLITKYGHRLTLKNYSENTLRAYLNGVHIFLDYVKVNEVSAITPKVLETYFHYCKKELDYSYSMMSQGLLWRNSLLLRYVFYMWKFCRRTSIFILTSR